MKSLFLMAGWAANPNFLTDSLNLRMSLWIGTGLLPIGRRRLYISLIIMQSL